MSKRKHSSRMARATAAAAGPSRKLPLSRREFGTLLLGLGASQVVARPARAEDEGIVFAIVGDYGEAGQPEQDVANLILGWNPEFIVTNGDNNYGDEEHEEGSAATIDKNIGQYYHDFIYPYKGTYGPGADINRFFPILADKDYNPTDGYAPYLDYFTLPGHERYYDFVWGPVHFFMMNGDTHEPDGVRHPSTQSLWLQARLAASTAPWKLVHIHHPPNSTNGTFPRTQWPFAEWGADVVSSGQAHVYERIHRDGIVYFVNGLGGRSTGGFETPIEGSVVRYGSEYGAQRVTATADRITFEFFNRLGELIDTCTLGDPLPALAAPIGLTLHFVSPTRIDLAWVDTSAAEQGFAIERSVNGGRFNALATVGANQTRFSDTNLGTATKFQYRVRAFSGSKFSAYSNTASTNLPKVNAPSNLTATPISETKVALTWQDNTSNELGFEIEMSTDGVEYSQIKAVGPGISSYTSAWLTAETTYYYRVRAYNDSGVSAYSNVAIATTKPAKPAPPSALSATAVSSSRIDLTWTDNSNIENGHKVYRSLDGVTFTIIKSLGPNVTSYSDTGRTPGTQYYYQVRAYNAVGNSAASNTASATTLAS